MIIGETFNNDYDGYEEDSYDYLFKRKTKEERQQRKADNKQKRADRKQQKQIPGSEGKRRLPILGNFGLFDKNKKKNATGTSTSSSAKKEPGSTSESSTSEEKKIAMAGAGAAAMQDKSEGGTPGSESAAMGTETAKLEAKELDNNAKPKEAGFGPMVGFAFLGIALLLAGIAVVRGGKRPISDLQPMKVAA